MVDFLEFAFQIFTEPLTAIATIALVIVIIGVAQWQARLRGRKFPTDTPAAVIRHALHFNDGDLAENRAGRMSDAQRKWFRRDFQRSLIGMGIAGLFCAGIVIALWSAMRWFDSVTINVAVSVVIAAIYGFVLYLFVPRMVRDLREGRVAALPAPLRMRERKAHYMFFTIPTHYYEIVYYVHGKKTREIVIPIGFMPLAAWETLQTWQSKPAMLYLAPHSSKLMALEMVG